jgi:YVTN family beta-propeller protein
VNPPTNKTYVANHGSTTVTVIDRSIAPVIKLSLLNGD